MMTLTDEYNEIRERVINSAESILGSTGLVEVKVDFSECINSRRRCSNIKTFSELLSVLQKRGHVSEHNITNLRKITRRFDDPELDCQMSRYEDFLQNYRRTHQNQYAVETNFSTRSIYSDLESRSEVEAPTVRSQFSLPAHSDHADEQVQIPERVIDVICNEIGKQWMELARKLGIREGEIDNINDKYATNLKQKAREVLRQFALNADPLKWQCKLLNGLVDARRRDLKENVEEFLTRRHRQ